MLGVNYYTNNDCHARDVENKWVIYERSVTKIEIHPFDEVATSSPHKIQIIGEAEEIIEIEVLLKKKFPHLSICRSHANFFRGNAQECNQRKCGAFFGRLFWRTN